MPICLVTSAGRSPLVIEHIGGRMCVGGSTPFTTPLQVTAGQNFLFAWFDASGKEFEASVLGYVDPGSPATVGVSLSDGNTFPPVNQAGSLVFVKGYLLDCGAAPCSPIAP